MDTNTDIIVVKEGEILSKDFLRTYKGDIGKYFVKNYKDDTLVNLKVDFVGFLIQKNEYSIVSFPKNYYVSNDTVTKEDLNILLKILENSNKLLSGSSDNLTEHTNFPYRAYKNVLLYYMNFGLYVEHEKKFNKNVNNKLNWQATMKYSNKIITKEANLIFLPFYSDENIKNLNLITESMIYVLNDGYLNFGKYFNQGEYLQNHNFGRIFGDIERVIAELNRLKFSTFKNSSRKLIDSLILYLRWRGQKGNDIIFATQNFNLYWEFIVEKYLNNFFVFDEFNKKIKFEEHEERESFNKIEHNIEVDNRQSRGFKVIFDHLCVDNENKKAFLFDSKYYNRITGLDYKQFSYYFSLLDYLYREYEIDGSSVSYNEYDIYNGLIIPSEEYREVIHLDTRNERQHEFLRSAFIVEFYLPIKDILKWYLGR
ncbi:hypothetical protein K6L05_00490 [Salinicoccus roseus]|uniref:hypothetical protein n=1 Tax=Salinicoccus roseus TaxID=45670 RepID=UPI001CA60DEE|nr:hypothetical protein [Salinicoccus roseus]MBY8908261.1 hypothetical protein [Salinicoccus roseus]